VALSASELHPLAQQRLSGLDGERRVGDGAQVGHVVHLEGVAGGEALGQARLGLPDPFIGVGHVIVILS
jgi:hypothetical protein